MIFQEPVTQEKKIKIFMHWNLELQNESEKEDSHRPQSPNNLVCTLWGV